MSTFILLHLCLYITSNFLPSKYRNCYVQTALRTLSIGTLVIHLHTILNIPRYKQYILNVHSDFPYHAL